MADRRGKTDNQVLVLATFPPPVTGAALVSRELTSRLKKHGQVAFLDWTPNYRSRRLAKLGKVWRTLWAPLWIAWQCRHAKNNVLYSVAHHGHGMYQNMWVLLFARLMGIRCFLHHHAFNYLICPDRRMGVIDRLMVAGSKHIVLGPEMEVALRKRYRLQSEVTVVSNGFVSCERVDRKPAMDGRVGNIVLGHLGNLRMDKGLDLVIGTHRKLLSQGISSRLVLAGPAFEPVAERTAREAKEEFGDSIELWGPTYGADKEHFFKEVDILLHPTRNDAQPLVVLEAMSHGCPALVSNVGCTASIVGNNAWVSTDEKRYVSWASEVIIHWIANQEQFEEARLHANMFAQRFFETSERAVSDLIHDMFHTSSVRVG